MNLVKRLILLTVVSLMAMTGGVLAAQRLVLGEMITNWG